MSTPNYEADAEAANEEATKASLDDLVKLIDEQLKAEAAVETAAQVLKDAEEALAKIKRGTLADLMFKAGLPKFEFTEGTVKLVEDMKLSVPKAKKAWLAEWLRKAKEAGMIKRTLTVELPEGPAGTKIANELIKQAKKAKCPAAAKDFDFHTGALKALLKKRREAGKPIPDLDTIGGFDFREARITLKKD